jgi:hypothetical protein
MATKSTKKGKPDNQALAQLLKPPAVIKPTAKAETQAPVEAPQVEDKAPEAPKAEDKAPAKAKVKKAPKEPANAKFILAITGKGIPGRGRFIEHRLYHTPWRHQARQFDTREAAQAWADTLQPEEGQQLRVVPYAGYQQTDADKLNWEGTPKIAEKAAPKAA